MININTVNGTQFLLPVCVCARAPWPSGGCSVLMAHHHHTGHISWTGEPRWLWPGVVHLVLRLNPPLQSRWLTNLSWAQSRQLAGREVRGEWRGAGQVGRAEGTGLKLFSVVKCTVHTGPFAPVWNPGPEMPPEVTGGLTDMGRSAS